MYKKIQVYFQLFFQASIKKHVTKIKNVNWQFWWYFMTIFLPPFSLHLLSDCMRWRLKNRQCLDAWDHRERDPDFCHRRLRICFGRAGRQHLRTQMVFQIWSDPNLHMGASQSTSGMKRFSANPENKINLRFYRYYLDEQQYCRKRLLAKLSKIVLGQNAKFFP